MNEKQIQAFWNLDEAWYSFLVAMKEQPASTATTLSDEPLPTEQTKAPPQGG